MGSHYSYSRFYGILVIILVNSWVRVSGSVHFVRFHDLDGLVCPAGDIAIARPADSQMICASFCQVYTACKSFFFDVNMGRCDGCNKVYVTTKHLLTQQSTEYFFDEDQAVALSERFQGLVFGKLYVSQSLDECPICCFDQYENGSACTSTQSEQDSNCSSRVFMSGRWGTVCNDGWVDYLSGHEQNNLDVVCGNIGFNSGRILAERAFSLVNPDGVAIWMDGVKCTGSEKNLLTCPFNGLGSHDCAHDEDVSVFCENV